MTSALSLSPAAPFSLPGADLALAAASAAAAPPAKAGAAAPGPSVLSVLARAAAGGAKTSAARRPPSAAGYAVAPQKTPARKAPTKTPPKTDASLAFLNDPKLSTEEKLFRFMMLVSARYDRALEDKMKAMGGKAPAAKAAGGSSTARAPAAGGAKKRAGILGSVVKAVKLIVPSVGITLEALKLKGVQSLVTAVSGPVLAAGATALGAPELAPVLLKAGPELARAAISVADSVNALEDGAKTSPPRAPAPATSGGGRTASSSGSSSSSSSSDGLGDYSQRDLFELQHLEEKRKEMFSLVSNILRSMHDTRMAIISNVRS